MHTAHRSALLAVCVVASACTAITREPEPRSRPAAVTAEVEPTPDDGHADDQRPPGDRPAAVRLPAPAPAPPPSAAPAGANEGQAAARHVLVMYRGSQRAPPTITRTRDEARARAEQVLARARRGDDFAALAREMSDEPRAQTSGGDLGRFGRGQMVPAFETAVFALRAGQTSEIVETPFGFHVIQRYE